MARRSVVEGEYLYRDAITFVTAPAVPASSFGNTEFDGTDPLATAKQVHRYVRSLSQAHGSAAAAERRIVHRCHGAGSIVAVRVGVAVACIGDSTITVDVKKNGTTVLSAPVVLDSGNLAYTAEGGALSVTTTAADACLEVIVTVSAGTGTLGQGLSVDVIVDEAAG